MPTKSLRGRGRPRKLSDEQRNTNTMKVRASTYRDLLMLRAAHQLNFPDLFDQVLQKYIDLELKKALKNTG